MQFRAVLSQSSDAKQVAEELIEQAGGMQADLAVLFASHHYESDLDGLVQRIHGDLNVRNLIGCTGESIIGPENEIEGQPAVAMLLASLPGVRILPFLVDQEDLQGFEDISAMADRVGADVDEQPSFVILAEPFTFDILTAMTHMDQAYPGRPKVGGLASGANQPGQNRLFLNDQALRQGMVGVALSGDIQIDTVVSQGCRPVGKPYVITKAEANIIEELGGHNAHEMLKEVFMGALPEEQELMQRGLHVGVVIDEHLKDLGPGDFLIHNLLGVYEDSKLAIGQVVRPGQTIQFHIRDASTADSEMRTMLASKGDELSTSPTGGLLFSCNGRGRRLFNTADHDIGLVNDAFGNCQVAGFFAQGEIGPIGGNTFIHGFTSSLILFREAQS